MMTFTSNTSFLFATSAWVMALAMVIALGVGAVAAAAVSDLLAWSREHSSSGVLAPTTGAGQRGAVASNLTGDSDTNTALGPVAVL